MLIQKIEGFRISNSTKIPRLSIIKNMQFSLSRTVLLVFFAILVVNGQTVPCQQGSVLLSSGTCQEVTFIEGCHLYAGVGKCAECEFNYDLNANGKCSYNEKDKKECCQKFGDNGQCAVCRKGLYLHKGACEQAYLTGCLKKDREQCLNCAVEFVLQSGLCYEGIHGCDQYKVGTGKCDRCQTGFNLTVGGRCIPFTIVGCSQQNGTSCLKCYSPFTLTSGVCGIENCRTLSEFGCSVCNHSFYPKNDGLCYPTEWGCEVYRHGTCVNCSKGFNLNGTRCLADGCSAQSATSCEGCIVGYELVNRTCRIPNCAQSNNGVCEICDDKFRVKDGLCVKATINCVDYVGEVCKECAPGFFLGLDGRCHPFEPGCLGYENGKCNNCSEPFVLNALKVCEIDGCATYEKDGCSKCLKPYNITTNKICKLAFCRIGARGICSVCEDGYNVTGSGNCIQVEKICEQGSSNVNCTKCANGFILNKNKVCEPRRPGCVYNNSECVTCTAPFLFDNGKCEIIGCKILNDKGCAECKEPTFELTDRLNCTIEGCDKIEVDGCSVCSTPYLLINTTKTCKIPNCLKGAARKCVTCESGFVLVNGVCFEEIHLCEDYSILGFCVKCRAPNVVSERKNSNNQVISTTCLKNPKTDSDTKLPNATDITFDDNDLPPVTNTTQPNKTNPTSNATEPPKTNQTEPNKTEPTNINTTTTPTTTPTDNNTPTNITNTTTTPTDNNTQIPTPNTTTPTETPNNTQPNPTNTTTTPTPTETPNNTQPTPTNTTTTTPTQTPNNTQPTPTNTTNNTQPTPNTTNTTNTTSNPPPFTSPPPIILEQPKPTPKPETILTVPPGIPAETVKVIRVIRFVNSTPNVSLPPAPTGLKYITYILRNPVTLLIKLVTVLTPIKDTPTALPGEVDPPTGYQYVTIEIPPEFLGNETVIDPTDPSKRKIVFKRVLKPIVDIPTALPGEQKLDDGQIYETFIEFIPGEGQEFEYVPVETKPEEETKTETPETPEIIETEPSQRSKRYLKIIRSVIRAKKFGMGSTIGTLIYSSVFNEDFSKNASLNSPYGWRSLKNETKEFVGLSFSNITTVERVAVQPGRDNNTVTEIIVEWSRDGKTFRNVSRPLVVQYNPNGFVMQFEPLELTVIRLIVTKYRVWPAMKFEVLYTDTTCREDLETDEIIDPDSEAEYDGRVVLSKKDTKTDDYINTYKIQKWRNYVPLNVVELVNTYNISNSVQGQSLLPVSSIGVLTYSSIRDKKSFDYNIDSVTGWNAQKNSTDEYVGLITPFPISVETIRLSATSEGAYISEFQIAYRDSLASNTTLITPSQIFKADVEVYKKNGIMTFRFPPIRVMEFRIIVKSYNLWPATKFDLQYSDQGYIAFLENAAKYKDQLRSGSGISSLPGRFSSAGNSLMKRAQYVSSGTEPGHGDISLSGAGFKSKTNKTGVYAGVTFKKSVSVGGLRLQNLTDADVITFYVEVELDGSKENQFTRIEVANNQTVKGGVTTYWFLQPVSIRSMRVYVVTFTSRPGFKLDVFSAFSLSDGKMPTIVPQVEPVPVSPPKPQIESLPILVPQVEPVPIPAPPKPQIQVEPVPIPAPPKPQIQVEPVPIPVPSPAPQSSGTNQPTGGSTGTNGSSATNGGSTGSNGSTGSHESNGSESQTETYEIAFVEGALVGSQSETSDGYGLDSKGGWTSKTNTSGVQAGLTFSKPTHLHGVIISNGSKGAIKEFDIKYATSQDKSQWTTLPFKNLQIQDTGDNTTSTYTFEVGTNGIWEIRIVIKSYDIWPSFKFNFFETVSSTTGNSSTSNSTSSVGGSTGSSTGGSTGGSTSGSTSGSTGGSTNSSTSTSTNTSSGTSSGTSSVTTSSLMNATPMGMNTGMMSQIYGSSMMMPMSAMMGH